MSVAYSFVTESIVISVVCVCVCVSAPWSKASMAKQSVIQENVVAQD